MQLPKEKILTYLNRRQADILLLQKSLSEGSTAEFNRIGHQLSGNAANFGFKELEPLALEMESLSIEKLKTEGPKLLSAFMSWLESAIDQNN